jgi:hypothetical protein
MRNAFGAKYIEPKSIINVGKKRQVGWKVLEILLGFLRCRTVMRWIYIIIKWKMWHLTT